MSLSAPIPPSSHEPSSAREQLLVQLGRRASGARGGEKVGGDQGGGGAATEGGGVDRGMSRGPQSAQSVPSGQVEVAAPSPPSPQTPEWA